MIHGAPAVILAVSLVLGCLAGHFGLDSHKAELTVSAAAVSITALLQPSPLALGAAGFFAGVALESLKTPVYSQIPAFGSEAFTLKGKIVKVIPSRYGQDLLTVRISETLGSKRHPVNFQLVINLLSAEGIVRGDEVVFRSFLKGDPSRKKFPVIRGDVINGSWQYGAGPPSQVQWARMRLKEALRRLPDSPASSFLGAVCLGERWRVDARTRDVLRKTGTYHLMAISGVHIGAAILPFFMIWRSGAAASQRARPRRTRLVLLIISMFAVGIYLCFTGLSASALRASSYFFLLGAALPAGRSAFSMTTLSWCVLVIVCFSSQPQPDTSLILSALAVAGIISGRKDPEGGGAYIKGIVRMTLGAFLFTLPVAVWLAGGISIFTLISNLAAGLSFGFFLIPLAVIIDFAALFPQSPLVAVAGLWLMVTDQVLDAIAYLADMPFSFMTLSSGGCLTASLAAAAGALVWRRGKYSTRSGAVIFVIVVIVSGSVQFINDLYHRDSLMIRFPAVGQADAAIIRYKGKTILMDCGPRGLPGRDCAMTRSLRRLGVRKINAIYLSHLHPDHAGGLKEILTLWPVETIYSPEQLSKKLLPKMTAEWGQITSRVRVLKHGDVVELSRIFCRVLGPDPKEVTGNDMNRGSLQILMEVNDFHALFTGDAGWDQVERILSTLPGLDLLKIPHHGSRNGFPTDGLEAAVNRLKGRSDFKTVCPSNLPGKRHLPAVEVVEWFAERGIELVYTGVNGVTIRH